MTKLLMSAHGSAGASTLARLHASIRTVSARKHTKNLRGNMLSSFLVTSSANITPAAG